MDLEQELSERRAAEGVGLVLVARVAGIIGYPAVRTIYEPTSTSSPLPILQSLCRGLQNLNRHPEIGRPNPFWHWNSHTLETATELHQSSSNYYATSGHSSRLAGPLGSRRFPALAALGGPLKTR